ncbi:MAG: MBL fold metallo-hydrolase [Clostridia bacterium]|nr:MBL fold metallo-hydrolase [Clostridia bacterium]
MRITFLGTSSGSPAPNTKCSCTLIEVGAKKYIIDAGTLIIEQLANRNINITDISALFITHMHRDHTDGLPSFYLRLLHPRFAEKPAPEIYLPQNPMQPTIDALNAWRACNGGVNPPKRPVKFAQVKPGVVFDDGVLKVTALPTKHSEILDAYSYILEAEGKRVFFSGDFSSKPVPEFHYEILEEPLDLAVCELGHFTADNYGIIFAEKPPKQLIINHISKKKIASAYNFLEVCEFPTLLAHDGMVIDV